MKVWELLGTQYTLTFVIVTTNLIVFTVCIAKCLTWYELSLGCLVTGSPCLPLLMAQSLSFGYGAYPLLEYEL